MCLSLAKAPPGRRTVATPARSGVRLPRTQRLVRVSAQAGGLDPQAAHPVTSFLRGAVAWALPTPLYMRVITETMSWRA